MKNMKKLHLTMLICLLAGCLLFSGCGKSEENMDKLAEKLSPNRYPTLSGSSVIQQSQQAAPEDALLYIVNNPTEDEMADIISYQLLKFDKEAPFTLLAPRRQGTILKLYQIELNEETGKYERTGAVWEAEKSDKGLIVAAQIERGANAAPTYELYIEHNGYFGSYFFELPAPDEEGNPTELPQFDFVGHQGVKPDFTAVD